MSPRLLSARRASLGGLAVAALVALRQSYRVRQFFAGVRPPEPVAPAAPLPRVSIVVPMRDEEDNVDGVLSSLLAQDYPAFDVTVIDDGSRDATPRLLAAWVARDARLRVRRIEALPEGWAGKAHALHAGVELTDGEWILFTDADTRHAAATLRLMLGHAVSHGDDLLSMLTDVAMTGFGMRFLTPIGALILVEHATPAELRDPRHRGALAIGHYLLVRRAAYLAVGGYAAPGLRANFADDVALAELFKRHGRRVDLVDGRRLVRNEQWTTWGSVWRGWRKSAYGEIAPRPLLGLAGGPALLAYGLYPIIALLRAARPGAAGRGWIALLAATILAAQVDARARFDRDAGLSMLWSLSAPAGWATLGLLVLDTTRLAMSGRGADWKGRRAPRR